MKSSTILGLGIISVIGVGTYIYLKSGKIPFLDKFLGELSPTSGKVNNTGSTTATTGSTTTPTSNKPTNTASVADISLGLQPKPTVDTVVSAFSETQTENYKKARELSRNISALLIKVDLYKTKKTKNKIRNEISDKTKQANALGYKILPYGEIEKM